ncbi:hypothetical protein FRB91_008964 [Serendipita sp. 411]|nr:hypothetical protein FRB91_008964 [Serendipita sp. 411]
MKYMDIPQLNQISRLLSYESSECTVHTRIEAYSMKPVTKDKRMWKALEKEYVEDQMEVNHALFGKDGLARSHSIDIAEPPRRTSSFGTARSPSISNSPIDSGSFRRPELSPPENGTGTDNENEDSPPIGSRLPGQLDKSERKILFTLKSTLNAAFPHHDFAALGADQFSREKNASAVLSSLSNTFKSVGINSSSEFHGNRGVGSGLGDRGVYKSGLSRATTYSAYPGDRRGFSPGSLPTRSESVDVLKELERRQVSEYDADVVSATHPVLFGVLDDAIGLRPDQCEVYVWTPPNTETDPHGGGGENDSEDEWPDGSSEEDSGDESGDEIFVEGDETESEDGSDDRRRPFYYPGGLTIRKPPMMNQQFSNNVKQSGSYPTAAAMSILERSQRRSPHSRSPTRNRLRVRGSLLWSNHWFFVNRKLKRVLFISIWAKSRGYGFSPSSSSMTAGASLIGGTKTGMNGGLNTVSERFVGWQGSQGAGARAFARKTGSSLF